jgi:hypothetical protein
VVTVTLKEPDFVGSATDVAVMVTAAAEGGAVKSPEGEIEPEDAPQVTDESKLPVPRTIAEH